MGTPRVIDLRQPLPRRSWLRLRGLRRLGLALSLVAVLAGAGLAAWHLWPRPANLASVTVVQQRVARHMLLPAGEQPELATVTDATKLQTPFLRQAHNGDKLLVYEKAGQAIIYRPSLDRIVAVGPVSIQPVSPAAGQ
ncbi:MAG TPA: hypothetical protein VLI05_03665 [Candidatus Saccharimonadia bacterium]|nr:hypothetical protein [Candidatus Saccharimonadia bacterium]